MKRYKAVWLGIGLISLWSCGPENGRPSLGPAERRLVIIDSVRPDKLGCYGFLAETSPEIDELARNGSL
jgi:hypothetical protein